MSASLPVARVPVMYRHEVLGYASTRAGALRHAHRLSKTANEHHTARWVPDRWEEIDEDPWFVSLGPAWYVGVALGPRE